MERGARLAYLSVRAHPAKARWGGEQQMLRRLVVAPTARGRIAAPAILNVHKLVKMMRRLLLVSPLSVWGGEFFRCAFQEPFCFMSALKSSRSREGCTLRIPAKADSDSD